MAYTGQTRPGAPADRRDLGTAVLWKLAVGPLDNNVYLLRSGADSLLIDAATDAPRILELVEGSLDAVVTTHCHPDHWEALAAVIAATGATTLAGADDADAIDVPTDQRLVDGDLIRCGHVALDVIALRGHTPGGVALALTDPSGRTHIFTGDSLFPGGVGKTSPTTFDQLLDDVTTKLFDCYPDDTWIYPGHGWDTTLGAERPHLEEWRERRW